MKYSFQRILLNLSNPIGFHWNQQYFIKFTDSIGFHVTQHILPEFHIGFHYGFHLHIWYWISYEIHLRQWGISLQWADFIVFMWTSHEIHLKSNSFIKSNRILLNKVQGRLCHMKWWNLVDFRWNPPFQQHFPKSNRISQDFIKPIGFNIIS